jgi:hypothetical protein
MNVSAASGRSIISLRLHTSWLGSAQQLPSDAVFDGGSKATRNELTEIQKSAEGVIYR